MGTVPELLVEPQTQMSLEVYSPNHIQQPGNEIPIDFDV